MQVTEFGNPAPVTPDSRVLAVFNFKARFTAPERIAARVAAKTDDEVADFLDLVDSIKAGVDLDHPMTTAGLAMLVTKGLLTSARATAIQSAALQDGERP